jgi:hypothetical protein
MRLLASDIITYYRPEYVGFKRSQEEHAGDWSRAMFIEAT